MPQLIPAAAAAAVTTLATVGLEMGLQAYAKSQMPEAPGTLRPFTQARPERCVLMGNPSRGGSAYTRACK